MSSNNIWYIVTHKDNPIEAAEYWKNHSICAFGSIKYTQFGANRDTKSFRSIRKGDLILAYIKKNKIAYVGEVNEEKIQYVTKNLPDYMYKNHIEVKWWEEPHHFSIHELPDWFKSQIPKPHASVSPIMYSGYTFQKVKEIIKNVKSGSGLDGITENVIHSSLAKLLMLRGNELEEGLKIIHHEKSVGKGYRPDFIAVDKDGRRVIIECKVKGEKSDLDQLTGYGLRLKSEEPRLLLVAFDVSPDCRVEAQKKGIECYEISLKFNKLF